MAKRSTIAVYIRVSTEEQNEASQKREIEQYLDRENFDLARVRWFIDKSTGDDMDRPEFSKMDRQIRNGTVSKVIVWKLDRLSRDMVQGMNTLSGWLSKGIGFTSVTQDFDFRGTIGKMIASLLLGFAEIEQQTRRERQRAGIDAAKEQGKYKGGVKGRTKRRQDGSKVNPAEAIKLRQQGLTYQQIANAMNVSKSSVRRYLGVVER
ncbi:recombinase family protein [Rhodopirellula sp. MGV]|uniref:recombinase family protein n=1 Tax=Rhodopirellula sp. MGV TaxID=2023130 RepID=UPI000B979C98|nr:recombinase family protein [Rhodopirellula sp. MGV]OYP36443.1 hypothetical protein CGZ80_09070 [Rhodopirellula sp. MGV]PNY36870.1 recombinase family protein [Rhodopirellula baltica]